MTVRWLAILLFFGIVCHAFAQNPDSVRKHLHERDTFYIVHERVPKSKLWGNSWYTGAALNLCRSREFNFNLGRTYGVTFASGGGFNVYTRSWGLGYSTYKRDTLFGQTAGIFGEVSNFFLPPLTLRLDYLYDLDRYNHYIRPSIGISLFAIDLMYNYSFRVAGTGNDFKHGFIIRLKYYFNNRKWQSNYPNRC